MMSSPTRSGRPSRSWLEQTHDRLLLTAQSPLAERARRVGVEIAIAVATFGVLSAVLGVFAPKGFVWGLVIGVALAGVAVWGLSRWLSLGCWIVAALFFALCRAWAAVDGPVTGLILVASTLGLAPVALGISALVGWVGREWRHQIELTVDQVRVRGPMEGVLRRDQLVLGRVEDRLVLGPGLVFEIDDNDVIEAFLAAAREPAQAPPSVEAPEEARQWLERVGIAENAPPEPAAMGAPELTPEERLVATVIRGLLPPSLLLPWPAVWAFGGSLTLGLTLSGVCLLLGITALKARWEVGAARRQRIRALLEGSAG